MKPYALVDKAHLSLNRLAAFLETFARSDAHVLYEPLRYAGQRVRVCHCYVDAGDKCYVLFVFIFTYLLFFLIGAKISRVTA